MRFFELAALAGILRGLSRTNRMTTARAAFCKGAAMKDARRFFTKSQAEAKVVLCNGLCEGCGAKLQPGFHMHHIVPHADGGQTRLNNCKALCKECHEKEHSLGHQRKLRAWQTRFLQAYKKSRKEGMKTFAFEATMGAGKSILFSEIGREALQSEPLDFLIQLVPWESIRGDEHSGMIKAYNDLGLATRETLMVPGMRIPAQPMPRKGTVFVVMYQAACRQESVELIESWVKQGARFGFLPDEIHHTSVDKGAWGEYADRIHELATVTVVGSGTYFRGDRTPIRFLDYDEDGRPILSCEAYSYSDAVRDEVVRPVAFRYQDPVVDVFHEKTGEYTERLSLLTGRPLAKAKRVVLNPSGETARKIVEDVHEYTCRLRNKFPDAAILFSCQPSRATDADEARYVHRIADLIVDVTRESPTTVVSSDAKAGALVERFRSGTSPYLVAINKVSEGVDIPRLRGVALLRYMESEAQFRQIVGRALRHTDNEDGTSAMVWLPKFPRMYEFALNMYNESLEGARTLVCQECGERPCVCPCAACNENPCVCVPLDWQSPAGPRVEVLGATPNYGGGSVAEDDVFEHNIRIANAIKAKYVSHRHANEVQLAHAIQCATDIGGVMVESASSPLEDLNRAVRKIHELMGIVTSRFFGGDYSRAWCVLFRNRYGIDFKEAKVTWPTSRMMEFVEVLKGVIKEGRVC